MPLLQSSLLLCLPSSNSFQEVINLEENFHERGASTQRKEEEVEEYEEPVSHNAVKSERCVAKSVNLFGLEFDLVMGDCYDPPTTEECLDRYAIDSNHQKHLDAPGWFEGCQTHKDYGDCEHDSDIKRGCRATCEICKASNK